MTQKIAFVWDGVEWKGLLYAFSKAPVPSDE